MKHFKQLFITSALVFAMFFLLACEDATQIKAATFSEITSVGSENYGVRISYQTDKRLEGFYIDTQIKFSHIGQVTFWEENNEKLTFNITELDEWYSLTSLIYQAQDKAGEEKFEAFDQALTKFYLFNFDGKNEVTMRVVAGQIENNNEATGQILVGSEPISDQFVLKIK